MSDSVRSLDFYCESGVVNRDCGRLVPIRSTSLAGIESFRYAGSAAIRIPQRTLAAYAIGITTDGTWEYRRGRSWHRLGNGSVHVVLPGDEYGCAHCADHPNSTYFLMLQPGALDGETGELFAQRVMRIDTIQPYLFRALEATDADAFDSRVFEIFDLVSLYSSKGRRRSTADSIRVQRMRRFIEQHFADRITLTDIAQTVGLNPFTCLRQFKAGTGETPLSYISRCRLRYARTLLECERIGIEEVARRSGFASHSYFARTFKRSVGITPIEYRRMAH